MVKLEVLNPRGMPEKIEEEVGLATRPESLDGKKIGLFWNGKPGADFLFTRIGELLQGQFKDVSLVSYFPGKPNVIMGAEPSVIKKVAEECDVVVNGPND